LNDFITYLKNTYNYSNYDIQLLKYYFKSLLYDLSKLIPLGIFFFVLGYTSEYLMATVILFLVRTSTGGLHFKRYISCLTFTAGFFIMSIIMLPKLYPDNSLMLILLLICMIITNYIGPIVSCYRESPSSLLIRKSKRNTVIIIFIYCILIFIIPNNHYLSIGFWVIILQTLQLLFAYINTKRRCNI